MQEIKTSKLRVSKETILKAEKLDPTDYLQSKGYTVKKEGRHYSICLGDDEMFRMTKDLNERFVSCDKYGEGIGNNISLVRKIDGCGFLESINVLTKSNIVSFPQKLETQNNFSNLNLNSKKSIANLPPQTNEAILNGRKYLQNRGIAFDVIHRAEQVGFLKYAKESVFFVGYDEDGVVKNVTSRAVDENAKIQKRDLANSTKFYPQILKGTSINTWIVEGGVDALALHTMALYASKPLPTVIVSGGANCLSCFENPVVLDIFKKSDKIIIARENEKNENIQKMTDIAHEKQRSIIFDKTSKLAEFWKPKNLEIKDLADQNLALLKKNEDLKMTQIKTQSLKPKSIRRI